MARVSAFAGRLVREEWATRVVSPLHDVLTASNRQDVLDRNPDSYLHVTSDRLASPSEAGRAVRSNDAALQRLVRLGAYGPVASPGVFVYQVEEGGRRHTGVVLDVGVVSFTDGGVLGHEAVQRDRVEALVRHFDEVELRSELVSLVHRNDSRLDELTTKAVTNTPILELTDAWGAVQRVWRVEDRAAVALLDLFESQRLFIADGHHRAAAAILRWERDGQPVTANVLCLMLPEKEVRMLAFHRRVAGPLVADELLRAAGRVFDVGRTDGPAQEPGVIALYVEREWFRLGVRRARLGRGVDALDVTLLDREVLRPVLEIGDRDLRLEFVPERRGLDEGVLQCDKYGGALFVLAPPALTEVLEVAERGEVMAPKSTYIEPKPRTGIFLR